MIETFKNKDGSITTRVTTVEETTISADEVEATLNSKVAQKKALETRLSEIPAKYEKLQEQEVASLKSQIESLDKELETFNS